MTQQKQLSPSLLFIGILLLLVACGEKDYVPKPRAYPRIVLPEKDGYQIFKQENCPFEFEYPNYGKVVRDTKFFEEDVSNQCWLNLDFEHFKGRIYLSYKTIHQADDFRKLIDETYKLTNKHVIRADYIDDFRIGNKKGAHGLMYEVGGNAASPIQFFLSDSTQHFLRGALYFNHTPNIDSIGPAVKFLKEDILHLVGTLEWKNN